MPTILSPAPQMTEERAALWNQQAESLSWFRRWEQLLDWKPPYAKWFVGGKLNACYNCLDRHMQSETRYKRALIWEGEQGERRSSKLIESPFSTPHPPPSAPS